MKKILIFLLQIIFIFNVYSLEKNDFRFVVGKSIFSITDTKEQIDQKLSKEKKLKKKYKNIDTNNYSINGLLISFLGKKVISMDLESIQGRLLSGIKIGDDIDKIYTTYGNTIGYKGHFEDGYDFIDYYLKLENDSKWKEPQYTLRFIYQKSKITEIIIFYTE